MKKTGILNSPISKVLAGLRHTDQIVIGDAGLPVPDGVKEIDISLKLGMPTFIDTLKEVSKDMEIEGVVLAEEIKEQNAQQLKATLESLGIQETNVEFVTHEDFKKLTGKAKAIIRTGEATPYSNVILRAGVIF